MSKNIKRKIEIVHYNSFIPIGSFPAALCFRLLFFLQSFGYLEHGFEADPHEQGGLNDMPYRVSSSLGLRVHIVRQNS